MKSWASIVKSDPPSTQPTQTTVKPREDDIFILKPTKTTKGRVGGGGQSAPVSVSAGPISEKQQSVAAVASAP